MIRTFKFEKNKKGEWYVVLPEWKGPKADLQMVMGADVMLDYMSNNGDEIELTLSTHYFEGADRLDRLHNKVSSGCDYSLTIFEGVEINTEMWLCDVTKFVFGEFPKYIFLARYS